MIFVKMTHTLNKRPSCAGSYTLWRPFVRYTSGKLHYLSPIGESKAFAAQSEACIALPLFTLWPDKAPRASEKHCIPLDATAQSATLDSQSSMGRYRKDRHWQLFEEMLNIRSKYCLSSLWLLKRTAFFNAAVQAVTRLMELSCSILCPVSTVVG